MINEVYGHGNQINTVPYGAVLFTGYGLAHNSTVYIYTCPAGKIAYLTDYTWNYSSGGNSWLHIKIYDTLNNLLIMLRYISTAYNPIGSGQDIFLPPIKLLATEKIVLYSAAANMRVGIAYRLYELSV